MNFLFRELIEIRVWKMQWIFFIMYLNMKRNMKYLHTIYSFNKITTTLCTHTWSYYWTSSKWTFSKWAKVTLKKNTIKKGFKPNKNESSFSLFILMGKVSVGYTIKFGGPARSWHFGLENGLVTWLVCGDGGDGVSCPHKSSNST